MTNLKEMVMEVEQYVKDDDKVALALMKKVVEAINGIQMYNKYGMKVSYFNSVEEFENWQKLKKLLGVKDGV